MLSYLKKELRLEFGLTETIEIPLLLSSCILNLIFSNLGRYQSAPTEWPI
jgi:hypothetical protein